jgi:hypothetical protein
MRDDQTQPELPSGRAQQLIERMIASHEESDLDCSTCASRMECLAELMLAGKQPEGQLAAIEQHIRCCGCCRSEFGALVAILRMECKNPDELARVVGTGQDQDKL